MAWQQITPPNYETADDLTEVKNFLKVSSSADNDLIESLIATAAEMIEMYTRVHLLTQTWTLWLDNYRPQVDRIQPQWWNGARTGRFATVFANTDICIELNRAPIQSITHIKTHSRDNVSTTFDSASYRLVKSSTPARVALNAGYAWPIDNLRDLEAYEIQCVLGYGTTAASFPAMLKTALRQLVFELYDKRGQGEMKMSDDIKQLLSPFVIYAGSDS